ncbi:MAG: toprim domain-containing protein [Mesorhizobium sp.]|uniref:DUF5906 domain-containing protein n=1 Tax=Mesorhizobium sp. TaxID=1871066 RepID=UPI000FE63C65|nr:DUF5906 domain-containing protein [Mesorhizobium sp.]RWB72952.1 MAG: toprim domain-containing protein [Mesorhizobium sp.]
MDHFNESPSGEQHPVAEDVASVSSLQNANARQSSDEQKIFEFLDAMRSAGVHMDTANSRGASHPIADGKVHRANAQGKKKARNQHVWYVLHLDTPASGAFGDLQTGVQDTWTEKRPSSMTPAERAALKQRMADTQRQREEERAALNAAAAAAAGLIMASTDKAPASHPYLAKKGLPPFPGLRRLKQNVKYVVDPEEDPRTARAGSLVVPLYTPGAELVSVQLIGDDGTKRFLKGTAKEGNYHPIGKRPEDPGAEFPIAIAEGYSTAARVHQATGYLTITAFDAGNLGPVSEAIRAKYPNARILFAADNDRLVKMPDGRFNPGVTKAKDAAEAVGGLVAYPEFDDAEIDLTDFDDLARKSGLDAVRDVIDAVLNPKPPADENSTLGRRLEVDRRVEMPAFAPRTPSEIRNLSVAGLELESASATHLARNIVNVLRRNFADIIFDEGSVYVFHGTHWHRVDDKRDLGPLISELDGQPAGRRSIAMGPKLRKDIVAEIEIELLKSRDSEGGFFERAPVGICVANGFVRFDASGVVLVPRHAPDQRARWTLSAHCDPSLPELPLADTLLHRLLSGAFKGDDDAEAKISLIGEMLGAAISGQATRITNPLALFLIGETAENGKSQILALLRALLPPGAAISLAPTYFADEKHRVRLIGCLANVVDEVDGKAIDSAEFKKAVLGERIVGRDVYSPAVEFTPKALHTFSCNALPRFTNGFDRGIRRRVLPISFNRTIPAGERIPQIAARIVAEEAPALLSFAVAGALRLSRNGKFTLPPSSADRIAEWGRADPVKEWAARFLMPITKKPLGGWPRRLEVYAAFRAWALAEGFSHSKIVEPDAFWSTLKTVPDLRFATINGYAVVYAEISSEPATDDGNYEDHEKR